MFDIKGEIISKGQVISDSDGRRYEVTEKEGELFAKSLFEDAGCGEYFLYQERINDNEFKIEK